MYPEFAWFLTWRKLMMTFQYILIVINHIEAFSEGQIYICNYLNVNIIQIYVKNYLYYIYSYTVPFLKWRSTVDFDTYCRRQNVFPD